MKVAIIGAGLAGLSCALELERNKVFPDIYERNSFIGEQHPHISALLDVLNKPIRDGLKYLSSQLGFEVKPVNTINSLVHISPSAKTALHGNFGYFLKRDKEEDSLKLQISKHLNGSNIFFNTIGDYEKLSQKYDYVIVSTGDSKFTNELGCWKEEINAHVRGAIILGNFDPNTLVMWINKDYCKNGYAYMTPYNSRKASLILVVDSTNGKEVDFYWEKFLFSENLTYSIVEEFKLPHNTGSVYPLQLGKILFAGNAGGGIDPFLGFGQLSAIRMGKMAAKTILEGKNYEKLIKNILKRNQRLLEFRKSFNTASNSGLDMIVTALKIPGTKHIAYYSPLNVVWLGSKILKLLRDD